VLAVISAASVTGMAAPVTGATPKVASDLTAGNASYNITSIEWLNGNDSPATLTNGKFNANSTYKARIVLTSATGYKFPTAGLTPTVNTVAVAGVVNGGDVSGNTITFVVTFPATGAAPTYAVTLGTITCLPGDTISNVVISDSPVAAGATVTLNISLKQGMQLKANTLKASYNDGTLKYAAISGAGQYTFTMPAYPVTVTAEFEAIPLVSSAIAYENYIELSFANGVNALTNPSGANGFTVGVTRGTTSKAVSVTSVIKPRGSIVLYVDPALEKGDIITVSYNNTAAGIEKLTDGDGDIPSFTNQSVYNNIQ